MKLIRSEKMKLIRSEKMKLIRSEKMKLIRSEKMKLINDTRTWPRGRIVDDIAPGLNATDWKAASARFARWTDAGVFQTSNSTVTGRGHHRNYLTSEVVLVAVAETLHRPCRLRIDAIKNIIAVLRAQLTDNPGANPIDLAAGAFSGDIVDPKETLVSFVPTIPQVVSYAEFAQHPMSVTICLHHILKPLAGILASEGARASGGRKYRLDN
jgi:hypothetical protein